MKKVYEPLTENMLYVLMALLHEDRCGAEITQWAKEKTNGRIAMGPATLYTILSNYLNEGLIEEAAVDGRKRTYRITDKGKNAYRREVERMQICLSDIHSVGEQI